MHTANFQSLIQVITGRDLQIDTLDTEIQHGKEYCIFRVLPLTGRSVSFVWKTALTDEKLLKSFITIFCNKYKEPNPKAYDWGARTYGEKYLWVNKSDIEREYAYSHHSSSMYGKAELLEQVQSNFNHASIETALLRYGFYPTEYGIGIFAFWETDFVKNAIQKMKEHLNACNIPFSNEFSDARWVYRFKINATKEAHSNLLTSFSI